MKNEAIKTPEFRLCFPQLFTPKRFEESGKELYSCMAVFPKTTDLSAIKQIARDAFKAKFPNGARASRNPIRDGNEMVEEWGDSFKDTWFIRLSSQLKPVVVDVHRAAIVDPSLVYSGCYARAAIHAYAYAVKGNKGVSFGFGAIQILRDGEPLSGGAAAAKLFDDGVTGDFDAAAKSAAAAPASAPASDKGSSGSGLFD